MFIYFSEINVNKVLYMNIHTNVLILNNINILSFMVIEYFQNIFLFFQKIFFNKCAFFNHFFY
jgi:hypothetical protein